jgi:hypothetical protein
MVETTAWPSPRQHCSFLFHGGALPELGELVAHLVDPDETVANASVADGE